MKRADYIAPMNTYNDTSVEAFLDSHERVMILFGASWCGPCKVLKPKFQAISDSEENADVQFAYCDVEETMDLVRDLGVQSVPTVVAFFGGEEIDSVVGNNEQGVKDLITKLKSSCK